MQHASRLSQAGRCFLTSCLLSSAALIWSSTSSLQAQGDDPDPADLTNPLAEFPAKDKRPTDPDLPQPFNPDGITKMLKTSPFNRSVNLSDSLVLTGVAYVQGKPMATLLDKESKQTYVVSDEPNASGWTLTEAPHTTDIKRMQVKVNVAGEIVTIRHDNDAQEETMKKHKLTPGGSTSSGDNRGSSSSDRGFKRDHRGPPPEVIQRFQNLSDGAKDKLRKHFEENKERLTNMNPEERRAFMEKSFKTIAEEDEAKRK